MPTYDYECRSCGHRFDILQKITADALTSCPQCKKKTLRRLIGGGIGIIFKGSGFYTTDNKSSSAAAAARSESKNEARTESKSDGRSDGKSDGKSENRSKVKSG